MNPSRSMISSRDSATGLNSSFNEEDDDKVIYLEEDYYTWEGEKEEKQSCKRDKDKVRGKSTFLNEVLSDKEYMFEEINTLPRFRSNFTNKTDEVWI